jgi:protein gp37
MAYNSSIEWTGSTWNPVTGCKKISPGCKNCYAERMAKRLKAMGQPNYIKGFELALHDHALELPIQWKRPQTIFVNSMSDLFMESVPPEFIKKVFNIMNAAHWHIYQVLTKRSERLSSLNPKLKWMPNIWMGVSVENEDYVFRIDHLRKTGAYIKFISIEPLLGPLTNLDLRGIDWVIVGGESGPGARPLKPEWVIAIRDQCKKAKIPFFFKQWGGKNKKKAGKELEGKVWQEIPSLSRKAEGRRVST